MAIQQIEIGTNESFHASRYGLKGKIEAVIEDARNEFIECYQDLGDLRTEPQRSTQELAESQFNGGRRAFLRNCRAPSRRPELLGAKNRLFSF